MKKNYKNNTRIGVKPKGIVKTMPGLVKRFGKLGFWHGFMGRSNVITTEVASATPIVKPPVVKPPVGKPKK